MKHGHDWEIDDINIKGTELANKNLAFGQYKEIRTKLSPGNRNKLRMSLPVVRS